SRRFLRARGKFNLWARRASARSGGPDGAPFLLQNGVVKLLVPAALEQAMLAEMRLPPHAQPLHEPPGRRIARVAARIDPVEIAGPEGEIEQRRRRFAGKAMALMIGMEYPAHLALPRLD